ncbi:MAG: phytoene/squalene synthase family protein [Cyclobacteriaceae bacterium]|nr:phytoene/squalene synthase family protein [Cyclobacteriaceae bacterium]
MTLFDRTTMECSKVITRNYSTSFSLGIRTLDKKFRDPIYGIYGFVRFADEIVDTFHDHDKHDLLGRFEAETYRAIDEKISLNPVLHSFQLVIHQYRIERTLIDAFLRSMRMDLHKNSFSQGGYKEYIYGSAEVVGLMCLRVFTDGNDKLYEELKAPARRLGAAFQKVNFLRDIRSDYYERGRIYFPGIDFSDFKTADKKIIEADIQEDFKVAYEGIIRLPKGTRKGVYLSYMYYLKLFEKIKRLSAESILHQRIRIPDFKKIMLIIPVLFTNSSRPAELYK